LVQERKEIDMTDTSTLAWTAAPTPPATADDLRAIRAAVLDYYEGWFDADAERMRRALHPALAKRSYGQGRDQSPALSSLTADQMVEWTAAGEGAASGLEARAVEIQVVDVSAMIATVVVRAFDYVEYLHLVAEADRWRIVNALWRWADGHGPQR
jgi:Putative lumazine-binding